MVSSKSAFTYNKQDDTVSCRCKPFGGTELLITIPASEFVNEMEVLIWAHPELSYHEVEAIIHSHDYWTCKYYGFDYFDTSEDNWYEEDNPYGILTFNKQAQCYEFLPDDPLLHDIIVPLEVYKREIQILHDGIPYHRITRGKNKGVVRKKRVRRNADKLLTSVKYWNRRYSLASELHGSRIECWNDFIRVIYGIDLPTRRPGAKTGKSI